jgi:hypothetical protein
MAAHSAIIGSADQGFSAASAANKTGLAGPGKSGHDDLSQSM